MPTSSQASATLRRKSETTPGSPARSSNTAPPLPSRLPGHARHRPAGAAIPRRGKTIPKLVPTRPDSSIGANSTNPRLRSGSVISAAAAVAQRSSSARRATIDFASKESQEAMCTLRRLFLPVVMRILLWRRRRSRWKGRQPPRRYTTGSVVAAIMSTKSCLADFPQRMLESLVEGATFRFLTPREIIVYANESHVSCGIVVLLYGQLEEQRPESGSRRLVTDSSSATRPIRTQTHRLHRAMSVLCLMPVMCEDRAMSFLATREGEEADVAIIPSRWFWEVTYSMTQGSLPSSEMIGRFLREVVLPHRRDILLADYFPTSVVLLRSWMWSMLTASDRVKLSRSMEVRVLSVGDALFGEGDYCPYIYVVRRGALTAFVKGEALAVLEAGCAIGEESVLFHDRRNCSVVAATVCELYALHVHHLLHRFLKYPECAQPIIAAAIERQTRWMEEGRTRDVFGLVSILSGVPCLGHTTDAMREEIARCGTVLTLPQGHTLNLAHTPCTFFCVIGRGAVALVSAIKTPSVAEMAPSTNGSGCTVEVQQAGKRTSSANSVPALQLGLRREVRSAGDFFGELCLKPHLWPYDVVCDSTVSVWLFDRDAVLRVLESNRADAQAIEVCRQGIALYRTHRGESSIVDGFDALDSPSVLANGRRSRASRLFNVPPPLSHPPAADRSPRVCPPEGLNARGRGCVGVDWTTEQWTTYAMTRMQEGVRAEDEQGYQPALSRDLREVDKEAEKAMKGKVLQLVAVQPETPLNPADSDFGGDSGELQSIIVEQLFLIVTEKRSKFLRLVNDSNIRLITEEPDIQTMENLNGSIGAMNVIGPLHNGEAPVEVTGVMRLEDISEPPLPENQLLSPRVVPPLSARDSHDTMDFTDFHLVAYSATTETSCGPQAGWPPPSASVGRPRRPASVSSIGEASGVFGASLTTRMLVSRSHLVRPPSGVPPSPRRGSGRDDSLSPAATGAMRPMSSSESRVIVSTSVRPTSVDFNQFNNKLSVDRSTSVLDRYVKIEDQNYFDNYAKVLPLPPVEIWASDEMDTVNEARADTLVLLLLHVLKCDHLSSEVMQRCARPIVKATLGQRVLVRTSVMENCISPRWSIEHSSFITFVRRGTEIVFSVCDVDDESRMVYQASLSTASIDENGGVGQCTMSLTELSVTGSSITEQGTDTFKVRSNGTSRGAKTPRITATMLAVTAAKYKALSQYLKKRDKVFMDPLRTPEITTLFLQVMSVEGLRHRIEANVRVSLSNNGVSQVLLETERVKPKTRSPAWSGDKNFLTISCDGGVLTFDLLHKGCCISCAEAAVDELVFGGIGLRRLPLLPTPMNGLVTGYLVLGVLGATVRDSVENRNRESVVHLAIEELSLNRKGFSINPDPFVVLRDGTGKEVLRTPLVFNAFWASWTIAEASCFLPCPPLCGSTVSYQLEVCDSDEQEVVGRATIRISDRGLGPDHRHSVSLDPPGQGVVHLRSLCLPVQELPSRGAAGIAKAAPALRRLPTTQLGVSNSETLLLLHVRGCAGLPGGPSVELHTDAIGTFSIDGQPYVRTPLQEATTEPRWPFSKASVLLRIPSQGDDHGDASVNTAGERVDLRQGLHHHDCHFVVYDGVVDDVNQIGQVAIPLPQLLNSSLHTYPLFPRHQDAGRVSVSTNSLVGEAVCAHTSSERTVGNVQILTLLGSVNHQVGRAFEQETNAALTSIAGAGVDALSAHLPYYNPESAKVAAAPLAPPVPSATVVLSVSNICHILPRASEKYIHLVVRHGSAVLLSVERQMGVHSHAEWGPMEASAAVSCATFPLGAVLEVELTAMDVVNCRDEKEEDLLPSATPSEGQTFVNGKACRGAIMHENIISPKFSLGRAEFPASRLSSVEAGEVQVVTLTMEGTRRDSSPEVTARHATIGSSACVQQIAQEVCPTVSLCIFGNRA
ncbi:hypothetical protein JKF63_00077 [Porcisia hertigi]|uniref:Uncharacterized protein n=1 Tax=Porcisia hertigi TaxID=2761500 RepID=A0A836HCG7_9TRYP|nr:hypothetical protein JKF63_00077 [Porcisia hertigi]